MRGLNSFWSRCLQSAGSGCFRGGLLQTIGCAVVVAICVFASGPGHATAQDDAASQQEESPAVIALVQLAEGLQADGEFRLAAESWDKLINQHPQSAYISQAIFGAGKCYLSLGEPKQAGEYFDKLVDQTRNDRDSVWREPSLLYAGFCQRQQAGQFERSSDEWRSMQDAALQTFNTMLDEYAGGKYRDQGLFLRGQTLDLQGEYAKAASDFQAVIDNFTSSQYYLESFLALGASFENLKQLPQAAEAYQQFLDNAEQANVKQAGSVSSEQLSQCRFRLAETTLKQAVSARENEQTREAVQFFTTAESLFQQLYSDRYRPDHCLYQVGFCQNQLGKAELASQTLAKMAAEFPNSPLAAGASIETARQAYNQGNYEQAYSAFAKFRDNPTYANESAHWMCLILIQQEKYDEARQLADTALGNSNSDQPYHVELLFDQADAVYYPKETRADSIAMYLAIVKDFPRDALVPRALYNAAYTAQETGDAPNALRLVDQFVADHAEHFHLPDVLQVRADAYLQSRQYDRAVEAFDELLQRFQENSNRSVWAVRRGQAQFFGKQYAEVIQGLSAADRLEPEAVSARGLYWKGAAEFELKQFADARASLERSLALDDAGVRSAEACLLLARTQFESGQLEDAINTASDGLQKYGQFSQGDRFLFSLGEFQYSGGKFQQAAASFETAIRQTQDDSIKAFAWYNLAWSRIKQEQFAAAVDSFNQLLDAYPEHAMAAEALLGRGMSYRQSGKLTSAVRDLQQYVSSKSGSDDPAVLENLREAKFELALAQLAGDDGQAGRQGLQQLASDLGDSPLGPKVLYELAWSYQESGEEADKNPRHGCV